MPRHTPIAPLIILLAAGCGDSIVTIEEEDLDEYDEALDVPPAQGVCEFTATATRGKKKKAKKQALAEAFQACEAACDGACRQWVDSCTATPEGQWECRACGRCSLRLGELRVFQTSSTPLSSDAPASVPVLAGKTALLRVSLEASPEWASRVMELDVEVGGARQTLSKSVGGSTAEQDLSSSFTIDLTPAQLGGELPVTVALREAGALTPRTTWSGQIQTEPPPQPLEVVVVPIAYSDGTSTRTPDVSPAVMEQLRKELVSLLPVAEVKVTVRAEGMTWSGVQTGPGLTALLTQLCDVRARDNPPSRRFYVGWFAPSSQPCSQGCFGGMGYFGQHPSRADLRCSVAQAGYPPLVAHELGHNMNRMHGPCGGAANPDPYFPHPTSTLGVPGFDSVRRMIAPATWYDLMSYCGPAWMSDYTYRALLDWLRQLDSLGSSSVMAQAAPTVWKSAVLGPGHFEIIGEAPFRGEPSGVAQPVELLDVAGKVIGQTLGRLQAQGDSDYSTLRFEPGSARGARVGAGPAAFW